MEITEKTGSLINDIDLIMRSHMGNNGRKDKLYHSLDTSEQSIRSNRYSDIRELDMGCALIDVLGYLETRCNISFDKLLSEGE